MSTAPIAKHLQLELSEASSDLRHIAKSLSRPNHRILKSLVEGKGSMDSAYKTVFINLLTSDEEASPGKVRAESGEGIGQMERPLQARKSGEVCRIIRQNGEDDSPKVKAGLGKGIEWLERPSHGQKSGKGCRMVDQNGEGGSRKVRTNFVEVMERPSQGMNRKRKCIIVDSSEEETEWDETDSEETESDDTESYDSESDDVIEIVERPSQLKNRKGKCIVKDQHGDPRGRGRMSMKNTVPLAIGGSQPSRAPCDHTPRVRPARSSERRLHGNGRQVVKQEREAGEKQPRVIIDHEKMHNRDSWTRRMRRVARGDPHKEPAFVAAKKEEPGYRVETRPPQNGIHRKVRKAKCAKCSRAYSSDEEYWEEGEGSSKSVPDVVILDTDKVLKKEIRSPFVSTSFHHKSMVDDEYDFDNESDEKTTDNEFRKELLEVLRKPFDRAELKRLRETYKSGLYACYHPDVQKRLTINRYKRENCLSILRGFMFWLKNVSRDGAFKPWKDKRYIELELPSD